MNDVDDVQMGRTKFMVRLLITNQVRFRATES